MTTDLRTGMTILEPHESWHLLKSVALGRLAVSVAGYPDIFPVNFVVDHGSVVFRTGEGTKLAAAVLGRLRSRRPRRRQRRGLERGGEGTGGRAADAGRPVRGDRAPSVPVAGLAQ